MCLPQCSTAGNVMSKTLKKTRFYCSFYNKSNQNAANFSTVAITEKTEKPSLVVEYISTIRNDIDYIQRTDLGGVLKRY